MLLTLHIKLAHIHNPPVWRRLTVPGQFTFDALHYVIQAAFGWENAHLYLFSEKGHGSDEIIKEPYDDEDDRVKDSYEIELSQVLNKIKQKYMYIYDFGDDWMHNITVEKIEDTEASKADCTAGKGTCPPEDCGGPMGYEYLKEILSNPRHKEYKERREWLGLKRGQKWNADAFDLEKAKAAVSNI